MNDRSKLSDIYKYVVDGDNAQKVYDILQVSYVGKNKKLPESEGDKGYAIDYKYEDGVLYIEEQTTEGLAGYISELLDFMIHYDSYYSMWERSYDGKPISYQVNDEEGKYFVRPPKTEYELQEEEERRTSQASEDMPF